jgi:hypothetical protein
MTKSVVKELTELYSALFKDAKELYPELTADFDRDEVRLRTAVEQRGIYALCMDLPAAAKHLVQALACGEYKPSGLPLTKRVGRGVVIPKLFRGLYLLIFNSNGSLKENEDVVALQLLLQFLKLGKKVDLQCSDENTRAEMLEFIALDITLPIPHPFWDSPSLEPLRIREIFPGFRDSQRYQARATEVKTETQSMFNLLGILDVVSGVLACQVGSFDPTQGRYRHGPGSVSNLDKRRCSKYRWSNWSPRLEHVFPIADCGYSNYNSWIDDTYTRHISDEDVESLEPFAKMVGVLKDFDKPRLILIDQSEQMWCQQSLLDHIVSAVEASWIGDFIAFRDQTLNQMLCQAGSVSGELATVDLSAASDRISCLAVGCAWRANPAVLVALAAARTQYVRMEFPDGTVREHRLLKFAGMGNACTFPVESMFFLSVAISATLCARELRPTEANIRSLIGEVSVFGDDIIVPTSATGLLCDLLHVLDCKVNVQKSFTTGRFRESCGLDAYNGDDVSSVYWHGPYDGKSGESYSQTIDTCNNFFGNGYMNVGHHLRSTLHQTQVPDVAYDAPYLGVRVPGTNEPPKFNKLRWNKKLQRKEWLVPVVETKDSHATPEGVHNLLQFFTEDQYPLTKWRAGFTTVSKSQVRLQWVDHRMILSRQGSVR